MIEVINGVEVSKRVYKMKSLYKTMVSNLFGQIISVEESEIEKIKRAIANQLSRIDYDSLIEVEDIIRNEKRTRPDELYF